MKTLRVLTLLLCGGLALGAYWSSNGGRWPAHAEVTAAAAADRTPLYYRDPGGAPLWSAGPKQDERGRDYLPVYDNDQAVPELAKPKQQAESLRKILYYRNPMGLP